MPYLTGVKLEKSAQPVPELAAGEELHPASAEEEEEEDKGEEAAVLEAGAVVVPVSIGMSSKLAVHTGPYEEKSGVTFAPALNYS